MDWNLGFPDLRISLALVNDTDGKARDMIKVQCFFRKGVKCFIKNLGILTRS